MKLKSATLMAVIMFYLSACGGGEGNAQASLQANDPRITGINQEILAAINTARSTQQTCGGTIMPKANPVKWNDQLAVAALRHTADMASHGKMSHTGSDGSTYMTRVTDAGYAYRSLGENVAVGYSSVAAVVAGWMASPGHCTNIMGASFSEIGAAADTGTYQGSPNRRFWTLDLASPK